MANLTQKQAHFQRVFQRFTRKYGYTPTMREMADAMGISISMVRKYQDQLVSRGAGQKVAGKTGGFTLT